MRRSHLIFATLLAILLAVPAASGIAAAEPETGTLTVVINTHPDDAQDFEFTLTSGGMPLPFLLDDDADQTLPTQQQFTIPSGPANVRLTDKPELWSISGYGCDDDDEGTGSSFLGVNLDVDPGEDITCQFHMVLGGIVRTRLDTVPDSTQGFEFKQTGIGPGAPHTLVDDGIPGGETMSIWVGGDQVITLTETPVPGWTLTSIDCTDGTVVNDATSVVVPLVVGQVTECTFTNIENATVTIVKDAQPDDDASFIFVESLNHGGSGTFGLGDDGIGDENKRVFTVAPGRFGPASFFEISVPAGWTRGTIDCTGDNDFVLDGTAAKLDVDAGEDIVCIFVNEWVPIGVTIEKGGPPYAHPGDNVTYMLAVTNATTNPLMDVVVSDDACVVAAGGATNDDGDALLERPGTDGIGPEVWRYTCSTTVAAAGSADPLVNQAEVSATDSFGHTVTAMDSHTTDILHPAIEVSKQARVGDVGPFLDGPIQAHVGDKVGYRLAVTTLGDAALAVALADAGCAAGTLSGPTGDLNTNGRLDLGETWLYACSRVITAADGNAVTTTTSATGVDVLGGSRGTVSATDTVTVEIAPAPTIPAPTLTNLVRGETGAPIPTLPPTDVANPRLGGGLGSGPSGALLVLGLWVALAILACSRLTRDRVRRSWTRQRARE